MEPAKAVHSVADELDALQSLRILGSSSFVSLHRFADLLSYPVRRIEELSGVGQGAAFENPFARRVQEFMRSAIEVVAARFAQSGTLEEAVAWFKSEPLADFAGRTPETLVAEGHYRSLLKARRRSPDADHGLRAGTP